MNFIKRCWNGEEKLWKVWWLLGGGSAFIYGFLKSYINMNSPTNTVIVDIAWFVFYVAWLNMVLSCAKNVKNELWANTAKTLVYLNLAVLAISLFSKY